MRIQRNVAGEPGFTLVEMVMIILLMATLSVAVFAKWPVGMDSQAAKLEFIQAVRFAKHMALTRQWSSANAAWGISLSGNKYYIGRADSDCQTSCANSGCADELMCNRFLLGNSALTLTPSSGISIVLFNGLGEPIDGSGTLLNSVSFTIAGSEQVTICAETGYVLDGGSCP